MSSRRTQPSAGSHASEMKTGAADYESERGEYPEKNPCTDPDAAAPQTPQRSSTEEGIDGFLCISEASGKVMAPCQNKCSNTNKGCGREGDPKLSAKGAHRADRFLQRQAKNVNEEKEEPDDYSNGWPCVCGCFHGLSV
jgi:hypothetical protein